MRNDICLSKAAATGGSDVDIITVPSYYMGVTLSSDGTNQAKVEIYDGPSATGTKIDELNIAAGGTVPVVADYPGIAVSSTLTAVVTGSNAVCFIRYRPK